MTGEGTIVLARASAYADRVRAYKVMLDGQQVGEIRNGETKSFPVPAGAHALHLKIDWTTSQPVTFDVAPGDTIRFACSPKGNALSAMVFALLTPKKYLKLERESPLGSSSSQP